MVSVVCGYRNWGLSASPPRRLCRKGVWGDLPLGLGLKCIQRLPIHRCRWVNVRTKANSLTWQPLVAKDIQSGRLSHVQGMASRQTVCYHVCFGLSGPPRKSLPDNLRHGRTSSHCSPTQQSNVSQPSVASLGHGSLHRGQDGAVHSPIVPATLYLCMRSLAYHARHHYRIGALDETGKGLCAEHQG